MDFLKYLDLCRICLCDGASIPVFGSITGEKTDISEKLALCFGEQIQDLYGYPRNICECCNTKVNDTVTFVNKYKASHKVLEKALVFTVKQEIQDYSDHIEYLDDNFDFREDHNIKLEAIVFDNAQQFKELIQPLATNIKAGTKSKIAKKVNNNNKVVHKKDDGGKKKKTDVKCKTSNNVIATAILEGEFSFASGQWRNIAKKEKEKENDPIKYKKKENNVIPPKKDCKPTEPVSKLCEQCGQKFNSIDRLKRHQVRHADQIPLKCTICQKSFNVHYDLKRHMTRSHGDKNLMCNICGRRFVLPCQLRSHNDKVHLKQYKKHPCKICGKLLCNAKMLLMHERSAHTGERPAVCSVCGKRFYHEDYLREHMRLHTGERPYKCPVCGRGYAQRGNMKSHMKHNHKLSDIDETTLANIHPRFYKYMKP